MSGGSTVCLALQNWKRQREHLGNSDKLVVIEKTVTSLSVGLFRELEATLRRFALMLKWLDFGFEILVMRLR